MEIYPAKSKFWEPNIGETFNAFLDFVKSERGINDPYDLNIIQNNAVNILKRCVSDKVTAGKSTKRTILHLGEVQSGKTLAMCSVIALAYELLISVLTGTKIRSKHRTKIVLKRFWMQLIQVIKNLFIILNQKKTINLNTQIGDLIKKNKFIKKKKMIVFTMLKHQSKINKLSNIFSKNDLRVSSFPIKSLILDDEADQASPNTKGRKNEKDNNDERSSINKSIIELRRSHSKFCTYIQVTATANPFLINKEDYESRFYLTFRNA